MLSVYDDGVEFPTLFTDKTLRVPGEVIIDLLNGAGYDLPEGAFANDAVVEFPMEERPYA